MPSEIVRSLQKNFKIGQKKIIMKISDKVVLWIAKSYVKKNSGNLKSSINSLPERLERILVLSTTAVGDTLLSTPVFSLLRKQCPSALIKVMIRDKYCAFFKNNPDVDEIIPFYKGWFGFYKTLQRVKESNFDIAFIAHISDAKPVVISALAGIPYIIGEYPQKEFQFLLSLRVPPNPKEHVIENRMGAVKAVMPNLHNLTCRMVLPTHKAQTIKIWDNFYKKQNVRSDAVFIGFQPGASTYYRMWPKENFINLGKKLLAKNDRFVILIFGSPDEAALCKSIENGIGQRDRAFFYASSLTELPHILKGIDCLVTNDTGPMHIAIAVGTQTVSLFVPSESKRIGPFQDLEKHRVIAREKPCKDECIGKKCKKKPVCMDLITVDEVFDAAMDLSSGKLK